MLLTWQHNRYALQQWRKNLVATSTKVDCLDNDDCDNTILSLTHNVPSNMRWDTTLSSEPADQTLLEHDICYGQISFRCHRGQSKLDC